MRPAVAIGASLDGARVEQAEPGTRATVAHGEVVLRCRWPYGPAPLRGAVVAALGDRAHVDHHGHLGDGTTRQARATVYYRVRDGAPVVWAYGPRAGDHLAEVAALRALRLPAGEVVDVDEAALRLDSTDVGVLKDGWRRYEVAEYFPSTVAYGRRPRRPGPERAAWTGQCLASSVRRWLADVGVSPDVDRPVHVHVHAHDDHEVRWRDREEAVRWGFSARFVANARLPDGIGLGQHVSEGFGEVRTCR